MSQILSQINGPDDLKRLERRQLEQLAAEIRQRMVETVSRNGGHLASSLGAVELAIAVHRVFDSPRDKVLWDVGHQSYAHKLLTGRREAFASLRQLNGISGFPVRSESCHDHFGMGHAGTSVSAAAGMALARDLAGESFKIVAIIGDGSLGAGIALEAVNHVGHLGKSLTVILNDNGMSISPSVGAISRMLSRVRLNPTYESAKRRAELIKHLPLGKPAWTVARWFKGRVKRAILPTGAFWEELGFTYLGPVDGHNLAKLEAMLTRARAYTSRPTLVHALTTKGKGHDSAEADASAYHGVSPRVADSNGLPSYSRVFGDTVTRLMEQNQKIVAISAAMLDGTGLDKAAAKFPGRVFDVGICEQHAVTLAAGLAAQGFIPIVAIYSTFLQRAYDQIIHDVCLQDLPVIFAVDRAGIVGDDGKTHQGAFDISYLCTVPGLVVAAPKDENELRDMLATAVECRKPMAVRYPRGNGHGTELGHEPHPLPLGKAELLRDGSDIAILAIGSTVYPALEAATKLSEQGIDCAVVNARYAKPLDAELITGLARKTGRVLTVEENSLAGGFGSAVQMLLGDLSPQPRIAAIGLPDCFVEHGSQAALRSKYRLDAAGIAARVRESFPELGKKPA